MDSGGPLRGRGTFTLELEDRSPARPPVLHTAVPNWSAGDTIPLGTRTLVVVDVKESNDGEMPVLVVTEA